MEWVIVMWMFDIGQGRQTAQMAGYDFFYWMFSNKERCDSYRDRMGKKSNMSRIVSIIVFQSNLNCSIVPFY